MNLSFVLQWRFIISFFFFCNSFLFQYQKILRVKWLFAIWEQSCSPWSIKFCLPAFRLALQRANSPETEEPFSAWTALCFLSSSSCFLWCCRPADSPHHPRWPEDLWGIASNLSHHAFQILLRRAIHAAMSRPGSPQSPVWIPLLLFF